MVNTKNYVSPLDKKHRNVNRKSIVMSAEKAYDCSRLEKITI